MVEINPASLADARINDGRAVAISAVLQRAPEGVAGTRVGLTYELVNP
jgi:hypothetical protein